MKTLSFIFLLLVSNSSFSQSQLKLDINIESVLVTDKITSGSGVVNYKHKNYIIGDDSPWLYSYQNGLINKEALISSEEYFLSGRVDKSQKLDFEDIDIIKYKGKDHLFIISSGSKTIYRDTLYVINPNADYKTVVKKNLRPLYNAILKQTGFSYINIEGITSSGDEIILAHRGNNDSNQLFRIDKKAFIKYIRSNTLEPPSFTAQVVNLPTSDGLIAGFSSLFFVKELDVIMFTASLENTSDVYSDGEIFGSYVGLISNDKNAKVDYTLLYKDGNVFPTKLEGITMVEFNIKERLVRTLAVSDNDDGKTEIFDLLVKY